MKPASEIRRGRTAGNRLALTVADAADREEIYRMRHDVYAREIGQHAQNIAGRLTDALDEFNHYLCVKEDARLLGFISVTPPGHGGYSVNKYIATGDLPLTIDSRTHELRILTVTSSARGREVAALLMYAALRWVEAHGGDRIIAIGRQEVLRMYLKTGMRGTGIMIRSGAVTFEVLHASVSELRKNLRRFAKMLERLEQATDWNIAATWGKPTGCFHGGSFFETVGTRFEALGKHREIINADVLDAWFPPAPRVIAALQEELPWLLATSPPTDAGGLTEIIAERRGVEPASILPGAGSSDLIFLALRSWLSRRSRVLLLDPTYGEYAHVLEKIIGCHVDRLPLHPSEGFVLDPDRLRAAMAHRHDLIILVNPNSPTGRHVPRRELEVMLRLAPTETRIWVDETYVDYVGADASLESFAAGSRNTIVCKSMSKVYALSGARVAYLCGSPLQLEGLRALTPPWAVSLLGQVAAVRALEEPGYYQDRYAETHRYREELSNALSAFDWRVIPGTANFVLCQLPVDGPTASELVSGCRRQGLFIRDASTMSAALSERWVRIAVKDRSTNDRMRGILSSLA
ncbi:MAG: aminotransferase class I/II-fold pyridoxal phosphate-dependent enzyme [Verrucomicrobia bacterium]|nr:aminotransferase class I/II-fold pyridoxal phosphate-dependent enzyme [Verrucomicrobiota bacterium]MBI3867888.1 aminotransferase class I/II-fold pyridoxal phosphate-dependent enzyme [Verrucomicrobiota bacterium]